MWYFRLHRDLHSGFGGAGHHGAPAGSPDIPRPDRAMACAALVRSARYAVGDLDRFRGDVRAFRAAGDQQSFYQLAHLDFSTVLTSVEEPLQRIQDYLTHFFSLPETQVSFKDTLISFLQSLINFDTINTAFSSVVSLAVSSVIAFFFDFVHHVLFPAGRRTFLCDGNGTFPGSIPTERDACPQFDYSASVSLLPGNFGRELSC